MDAYETDQTLDPTPSDASRLSSAPIEHMSAPRDRGGASPGDGEIRRTGARAGRHRAENEAVDGIGSPPIRLVQRLSWANVTWVSTSA
jgi:hypothetical protein